MHITSMNPQAKFLQTVKSQKKISRNFPHTQEKCDNCFLLESLLPSDSPEIWYQAPPLKLGALNTMKNHSSI